MHPEFLAKTHSLEPHFLIGEVAEMTGASPRAIRLYESLKLIPRPARRGTYRVYSERDVVVIHMIKHAQSVDFALAEIRDIVAEKIKSNRFPLKTAIAMVERKRRALRAEIAALRDLDRRLAALRDEMNNNFA